MNGAPKAPSIEAADISWDSGVPESSRFGDIYFSRVNGLAETRHVFIEHNQLPERFARLAPGQAFVVAESGFGTGLNFLATWLAWQESRPAEDACLHFISVERYPLTANDLARALALWPQLEPLAKELKDNYPPLVSGVHRLVLDRGRVRLTLFFGDLVEGWNAMDFKADAWFLDGFSPALNPDMWLDEALTLVRKHSNPGATLATFTAVGRIRRALSEAGFTMHKKPGFGSKRDMLTGVLEQPADGVEPPQAKPSSVALIGAGIAGCLMARNLAERGISVTLLDPQPGPGTGASGNLQGALYVKPGVQFNSQTRLALASLVFSQRFYRSTAGTCWHPSGLLQLAFNEEESRRQTRLLEENDYPPEIFRPVDREEASRLAGIPLSSGGFWYPHSGWLEPGRLCRQLADHPRIRRCFGFAAHRLTPCNGRWHIAGNGEQDIIADQVVICAGHKTPELIPLRGAYRFRTIRGQVTHLPSSELHSPRAVICGPRYLNPAHQGVTLVGATFDLHDLSTELSPESHQENIDELESMIPGVWRQHPPVAEQLEGKVGFRCTTHDYQPVAGPLTDARGQVLDGIYLLTGLGSKGLSYGPLLAEYLADQMTGQPACLPLTLARRVATTRCHKPKVKEPVDVSA